MIEYFRLKNKTWIIIANQFSQDQEGVPHRSYTTLMTRYRNKKTQGKKELADKRMRSFFSEEETKKKGNCYEWGKI